MGWEGCIFHYLRRDVNGITFELSTRLILPSHRFMKIGLALFLVPLVYVKPVSHAMFLDFFYVALS
jgi:hypothetical protein